jgi:hypothetical protein
MTCCERHEISKALHVQVFSLGIGRETVISPMYVGTVLPLEDKNGCSWKMPFVSFPTITTSLPAVCHFVCATSNMGVKVRNPKSNSTMLSRIEVTSHRFLVPSGDLSTHRFCHGLISHADQGMTCQLVAGYLCFRAMFLNRRATAWYRALASIILGHKWFSWKLSLQFSTHFS